MGEVSQEIVGAAISPWPGITRKLDRYHTVLGGTAAKQDSPRLAAILGLGCKLTNPVANLRRNFDGAVGHAPR